MAAYSWEVGEIAFLNQRELLSETNAAATAYMPPQTFGHPMIILRKSDETGYALVTSVTAFGSGPQNDFLPPWDHPFHRHKPSHLFRSFEGSARPPRRGERPQAAFLRLRDGQTMPKEKTSWVYARWSHIIPISALVTFNKSACRLRLTEASLDALIGDMARLSRQFAADWADARVAVTTTTTTAPVATTPGTPKKTATKKTTPVTTTPAPAKTASPPVKATTVVVVTTPGQPKKTAPVAHTPKATKTITPVTTTPVPAKTASPPVKATTVVVVTTPAPVKTTTPGEPKKAAPVAHTPKATKTTAPVTTTPAPAKTASPPVKATTVVVVTTPAPTAPKTTTPAPAKTASPPVKATTVVVVTTPAPVRTVQKRRSWADIAAGR